MFINLNKKRAFRIPIEIIDDRDTVIVNTKRKHRFKDLMSQVATNSKRMIIEILLHLGELHISHDFL